MKETSAPGQNQKSAGPSLSSGSRSILITLFVLACLMTVVALFYEIEDWRGQRVWNRYMAGPARNGPSLNWNDYQPAPVPDDQNVFKAPHIQEWFVRLNSTNRTPAQKELMERLSAFADRRSQGNGVLKLLEIYVPQPGEPMDSRVPVLRLDEPSTPEKARQLLRETVGPALAGAQGSLIFLARGPEELKRAKVYLEASSLPPVHELQSWFQTNAFTADVGTVGVSSNGSNTFEVSVTFMSSCYSAADYLAWAERLDPELDMLRDALQRPFVRMEGDYRQPFAVPVANFVLARSLAQTLAQRTQCALLLGKPEAALRDLTLLHDMRRLLQAEPEHQPVTLVAAMIDIAITGLYVDVIGQGLALGAWRASDLEQIEGQLSRIELLPLFVASMAAERAGGCHLAQHASSSALSDIFVFSSSKGLRQQIETLLLRLVPRGWRYQNMYTVASLEQQALEAVDLTNFTVSPKKADSVGQHILSTVTIKSPYTYFAAIAVPNCSRALQVSCRTESLVRQALVACALQRYRLATGSYPDTLDALAPKFVPKVPSDVIRGQTFRYSRTEKGFLLYSMGWNEKDDGGLTSASVGDADWVWNKSK